MPVEQGEVPAPALILLLGLGGALLLDDLASNALTFPLKAFWKLLESGLCFSLGVWAWFLPRRQGYSVVGIVMTASLCLAGLFNLLSLWYAWQAELIGRGS